MMGSRNAGVPLIQFAPKSKVHASLMGMAAALSGKSNGAEKKQPKGSMFDIFLGRNK